MDKRAFNNLVERYLTGIATDSEKLLADEYYKRMAAAEDDEGLSVEDEKRGRRLFARINNEIEGKKSCEWPLKPWYIGIAASALLLLFVGIIGLNDLKERNEERGVLKTTANDLSPGRNRAMIRLEGGKEVWLDDMNAGLIELDNKLAVQKTKDGLLIYRGSEINEPVRMNEIIVPRGGQYNIVLPDGTKVWVNAGSSLKFPSAFIGRQRIVELEGEAYFEVTGSTKQQFIVKSGDIDVTVWGTAFNVSNYKANNIASVTLLKGSVDVNNLTYKRRLVPSMQASFRGNEMPVVKAVNVEDVVAWKNGVFVFNEETIESIMQKLSNWYDADVVFEGRRPEVVFSGSVPRNSRLSSVLEILEQAGGVSFEIKSNRKVIVRTEK